MLSSHMWPEATISDSAGYTFSYRRNKWMVEKKNWVDFVFNPQKFIFLIIYTFTKALLFLWLKFLVLFLNCNFPILFYLFSQILMLFHYLLSLVYFENYLGNMHLGLSFFTVMFMTAHCNIIGIKLIFLTSN